jgi:hypothetical protein
VLLPAEVDEEHLVSALLRAEVEEDLLAVASDGPDASPAA